MANPELVEDGEELIVDLLTSSAYKYIESGEGTTPPAKNNTDTESEIAIARTTGTQSEASPSVYQVVGEITYDGTYAVTEACIFSASTGGVLFIRGTFTAINVGNGDKIEFTFTLEIL